MKFIFSLLVTLPIYAGSPAIDNIQLEENIPKEWPARGEYRVAHGEPRYKIAIIDTGYDENTATEKLKLCKTGHFDMFTKQPRVNYRHPHGSQVASIIAKRLKNVDYCAVVLQIVSLPLSEWRPDNTAVTLTKAMEADVDAVNMSFGGVDPVDSELGRLPEKLAVQAAGEQGIVMFMAAGNDSLDLDKECNAFPACYQTKNKVVVGYTDPFYPNKRNPDSNYGKVVKVWARGDYQDKTGYIHYGSSYAAPRALAEYILFLEHKRLGQ